MAAHAFLETDSLASAQRMNRAEEIPSVSVIIPCYNHARFLGEAVESVSHQTYRHFEIIVVDDGSTDESAQIAAQYDGLRYVRQMNQGLAAARNTGLRESKGEYLVFLDADDRLRPEALEIGVHYLKTHPECGFVFGRFINIAADGSPIGDSPAPWWPDDEPYATLLRRNSIAMHATVMYSRDAIESSGGFNPSLKACEDYDLYLRLVRRYPVKCHDTVVAEYRRHATSMSQDHALMLRSAVSVLRAQRIYLGKHQAYSEAYKAGTGFWQMLYGEPLAEEVIGRLKARQWKQVAHGFIVLLRYYPKGFMLCVSRGVRKTVKSLSERTRMLIRSARGGGDKARRRVPSVGNVRFGSLRRVTPISRAWGFDRGCPVDRYYIEQFLSLHRENIRGRVLEIGDDSYTRAYGGNRVMQSDVLHVTADNPKATFVGDLVNADHIPSDAFDCVILTQTLHLIYDMRDAVRTLHRILKPEGVLLATVPGITQICHADRWSESWYWSLTTLSARKLFEEVFQGPSVTVDSYGNVLAATAFLQGLSEQELRPEELDFRDMDYQLIVTIKAMKTLALRTTSHE